MKYIAFVLVALAILGSGVAQAATIDTTGLVGIIFVGPSPVATGHDVTVALDQIVPGSKGCGSVYFHILRTNPSFKEMYAEVLTAHSLGKTVRMLGSTCVGDRNIVDSVWTGR
jgi:hypothetical protein